VIIEQRLCVIHARGGRKRIEEKNARLFLGKPILSFSILTTLQSGCFNEVMVFTDDPQIAELARRLGAALPFPHSAQTSGDTAGLVEVLLEVLSQYAQVGHRLDIAACILATAPLLTDKDLKEAMSRLAVSQREGIQSVGWYSYPIQRSHVERNGRLRMRWPRYYRSRSRDLDPNLSRRRAILHRPHRAVPAPAQAVPPANAQL
jgi:pseudaminic acid cytidylyltransferase